MHLCQLRMPQGALVKTEQWSVVSPELMFMQLANELPILKVILLGLLMCSLPEGREVVTAVGRLEAFTREAKGHRGRRKALRAIRYLQGDCRSPMEALLFMFLSLPHALGGCAFRGATFNHRVMLPAGAMRELGVQYCVADIYFALERVIIEYDSRLHHDNPQARTHDALRKRILEDQGYVVIQVRTRDFFSLHAFVGLVKRLAKVLRRRLRIRTERFKLMFQYLRMLLGLTRAQTEQGGGQQADYATQNRQELVHYFQELGVSIRAP